MEIYFAREPVFDTQQSVFGYALHFRHGFEDYYEHLSPRNAEGSIPFFKFRELTDGRKGIVPASRELLLQLNPFVFPAGLVTLNLPDPLDSENEVITACRRLRTAGISILKDIRRLKESDLPFLDVLDIARVDFQATSESERREWFSRFGEKEIPALASRVDTVARFEQARSEGFAYFQGSFFARPTKSPKKKIPLANRADVQRMNKAFQPKLLHDELAHLIEQDESLSRKLLRFINSPWFGFKYEIKSIRHALVLLGPQEIKRWLRVAIIRDAGRHKPPELLLRCFSRARLAEHIGQTLPEFSQRTSELFLLGLLSGIDALLDQPMDVALQELPITGSIPSALLGEGGDLRDIYDLILAYERGEWETFSQYARRIRLNEEHVPGLVSSALQWGNNILGEA